MKHILLVGTLELFLAGCAVEVDVEDVEVTWRRISFQAVPVVLPSGLLEDSLSCDLNTTNVSWAKELDANVRAMNVRLHAVNGVSDLDFIQFATVTMSTAANSADAIQIMAYERTETAPTSSDIVASNPHPIDVTRIWSDKHARVNLTTIGRLPTTPWSFDLTLVVSGQINCKL